MQAEDLKQIKRALISFVLLVLGMLWAPAAVMLDVVVIGHGMPEIGVTEMSQELLLLLTVIVAYTLLVRSPEQRGFLVLVAGLFLCMLIRELDYLFDRYRHGFWKYPVSGVLVVTLLLAALWRRTVIAPMAAATRSMPFAYVLAGLAVVLFFSRVFGTGSLWTAVLDAGAGVDAPALVKNSVQEGLELLGYVLIFYGMLRVYLQRFPLCCSRKTPQVDSLSGDTTP